MDRLSTRIPLLVKTISHYPNKEKNKGLTSEGAEARNLQQGCQIDKKSLKTGNTLFLKEYPKNPQ
jgi:hypothetical protein